MHDPQAMAKMPYNQFAELLEPLSRSEMKNLLVFMHGYSPEGMAAALNFEEATAARRAERAAQAGRQAAAPAQADDEYRLTPKGEEVAGAEAVITDSERTCGQANPDSGAWCHKGGSHAEHRDTDGETWTTAGLTVVAKAVAS